MESLFLTLKSTCRLMTERAMTAAQDRTGHFGAQALALLALRMQGPCRLVDLAAALDTKKPATTTLVQRLEAQGLVTRGPAQGDGRAMVLALTDSGEEAADKVAAMVRAFDAALQNGFTADDMTIIHRFLAQAASLDLKEG